MKDFINTLNLTVVSLCVSCVNEIYFRVHEKKPEISALSTRYINANGGDTVVFTGKNLGSIKSIQFNGSPCVSMNKISTNTIECVTPSNSGEPEKVQLKYITNLSDEVIQQDALTYVLSLGESDDTYGYLDRTLATPSSIKIVGSKMLLVDYNGHRVLIWNTIPTSPNSTTRNRIRPIVDCA